MLMLLIFAVILLVICICYIYIQILSSRAEYVSTYQANHMSAHVDIHTYAT